MNLNNQSNKDVLDTINNDEELNTLMDTVLSLVKTIDNYLRKVSTNDDNYYNHQNVINYQDILNEYSCDFLDI